MCVCDLFLGAGNKKTSLESGELATRLVDILWASDTIGEEMECGWVRTRIRSQSRRHRRSSGYTLRRDHEAMAGHQDRQIQAVLEHTCTLPSPILATVQHSRLIFLNRVSHKT